MAAKTNISFLSIDEVFFRRASETLLSLYMKTAAFQTLGRISSVHFQSAWVCVSFYKVTDDNLHTKTQQSRSIMCAFVYVFSVTCGPAEHSENRELGVWHIRWLWSLLSISLFLLMWKVQRWGGNACYQLRGFTGTGLPAQTGVRCVTLFYIILHLWSFDLIFIWSVFTLSVPSNLPLCVTIYVYTHRSSM